MKGSHTHTPEHFRNKRRLSADRMSYHTVEKITVTIPEVQKILQGLNPAKAAGPDGISPRVLKES